MGEYNWSNDAARLAELLKAGVKVIYRHGPKNILEIVAEGGRIDLNQGTIFGKQWISVDEFVSLFKRLEYKFLDPSPRPHSNKEILDLFSSFVGRYQFAIGEINVVESGTRPNGFDASFHLHDTSADMMARSEVIGCVRSEVHRIERSAKAATDYRYRALMEYKVCEDPMQPVLVMVEFELHEVEPDQEGGQVDEAF